MIQKIDEYNGTNFQRVSIQLLSNIQELLQTKTTIKELKIIEQLAVITKLTEMLLNKEGIKNEK